jgi:hypothetical protein
MFVFACGAVRVLASVFEIKPRRVSMIFTWVSKLGQRVRCLQAIESPSAPLE